VTVRQQGKGSQDQETQTLAKANRNPVAKIHLLTRRGGASTVTNPNCVTPIATP
jgi:hypothetical protein